MTTTLHTPPRRLLPRLGAPAPAGHGYDTLSTAGEPCRDHAVDFGTDTGVTVAAFGTQTSDGENVALMASRSGSAATPTGRRSPPRPATLPSISSRRPTSLSPSPAVPHDHDNATD